MLQLKAIKKSYTVGEFTQVALDGVDLSFRENEFVAILGPSGSGKTTSLNIIGGLDQYDSGDLIINGKSTKAFRDRDWDAYRNNSVGFVFQSYNLISHLSITDNVEMGMTLSGISPAKKRQKALEVLERVGLKDHVHKKPNQLSGGQMQRVAIARALANDPDIILADEPTGALDTKTSRQIMDLIKEIAEDKLVIMVTHNPELAKTYADRTVRFQDGKVIDDTNPYHEASTTSDYTLKRTSMNYLTALKISAKNIATKKWRTGLTAFASSIGLIGIAVILSLSNGFQQQIDAFQEEALAEFPIMILRESMNINAESIQDLQANREVLEARRFTEEETIYLFNPDLHTMRHTNLFSDAFLAHIDEIDPNIVSSIGYMRFIGMNLLRRVDNNIITTSLDSGGVGMMGAFGGGGLTSFPETLGEENFSYLEQNYDLLAGAYPESDTDLILVVDEFNRINLSVLESLGFDREDLERIAFDEILGLELRLATNNDFYIQTEMGNFLPNQDLEAVYHADDTLTLTIAGIFRINPDVAFGLLNPGIIYSDALAHLIINREYDSEIVVAQREADHNVMTLEAVTEEERDNLVTFLGGSAEPFAMFIYPHSFEAKEEVLNYLHEFNEQIEDDIYHIVYIDQAEMITNLTGNIMDTITIVLIAFASISLIVSLIMIAIITYISVLERTKEIGILRALGARKKDITRVFNAETFIIGFCSGILAITISYLLTIPINQTIESMTDLANVAILSPLHATLLVIISLILTLLGGMIPALMAAGKDPVEALRTE